MEDNNPPPIETDSVPFLVPNGEQSDAPQQRKLSVAASIKKMLRSSTAAAPKPANERISTASTNINSNNDNVNDNSNNSPNGNETSATPAATPSANANGRSYVDPNPPQLPEDPNAPFFSERNAADVIHFVKNIYQITIPVLICIVLVIWWVQVREIYIVPGSDSDPFGFVTINNGSPNSAITQGVVNALIVMGVIIGMTIIFVILFWYGFQKIIFVILIFTVVVTFGAQGGLFIWYELEAVNFPLDWLTYVFVLYNFTAVGLYVVFFSGPLRIQQAYLVIMSALMAFVFTQIDEWTTWLLLVFLVLWDLFAVLAPCGPLKLLIEASQRQNAEIPALLYSVTMLYFMADYEPPSQKKQKKKEISEEQEEEEDREEDAGNEEREREEGDDDDDDDKEEEATKMEGEEKGEKEGEPEKEKKEKKVYKDKDHKPKKKKHKDHREKRPESENKRQSTKSNRSSNINDDTTANNNKNNTDKVIMNNPFTTKDLKLDDDLEEVQLRPAILGNIELGQNVPTDQAPQLAPQVEPDEEDEERNGLKLGLGDFVFYSVLVGRAALTDWTTLLACTVAVLSGLNGTIILLAIFKRALPALPISLSVGLVFYFVTSLIMVPYFNVLQDAQIFV